MLLEGIFEFVTLDHSPEQCVSNGSERDSPNQALLICAGATGGGVLEIGAEMVAAEVANRTTLCARSAYRR